MSRGLSRGRAKQELNEVAAEQAVKLPRHPRARPLDGLAPPLHRATYQKPAAMAIRIQMK